MLQRIAIAFRCGSDQIFCVMLVRDLERVHGSNRADFQGVNSVDHVIDGTRGRGEVKNVIYFSAFKLTIDIELQKFKVPFAPQVLDIGKTAGEQVVHGNHRISFSQQRIAQMRAEKAGASRDQGPWPHDRLLLLSGGSTAAGGTGSGMAEGDRKSTRLNSSHGSISYAV